MEQTTITPLSDWDGIKSRLLKSKGGEAEKLNELIKYIDESIKLKPSEAASILTEQKPE